MLATRLAKQEEQSIRRTHSALIPAYLMRDDGTVIRIWPSGKIEQISTQSGKCVCSFPETRSRTLAISDGPTELDFGGIHGRDFI